MLYGVVCCLILVGCASHDAEITHLLDISSAFDQCLFSGARYDSFVTLSSADPLFALSIDRRDAGSGQSIDLSGVIDQGGSGNTEWILSGYQENSSRQSGYFFDEASQQWYRHGSSLLGGMIDRFPLRFLKNIAILENPSMRHRTRQTYKRTRRGNSQRQRQSYIFSGTGVGARQWSSGTMSIDRDAGLILDARWDSDGTVCDVSVISDSISLACGRDDATWSTQIDTKRRVIVAGSGVIDERFIPSVLGDYSCDDEGFAATIQATVIVPGTQARLPVTYSLGIVAQEAGQDLGLISGLIFGSISGSRERPVPFSGTMWSFDDFFSGLGR